MNEELLRKTERELILDDAWIPLKDFYLDYDLTPDTDLLKKVTGKKPNTSIEINGLWFWVNHRKDSDRIFPSYHLSVSAFLNLDNEKANLFYSDHPSATKAFDAVVYDNWDDERRYYFSKEEAYLDLIGALAHVAGEEETDRA